MAADIKKFLEEKKPLIDSVIKKYLPEKFDKKYIDWAFGKPGYDYNTKALEKALAEPIWEFLNRGGKRWRPALFLLFVEALGGDLKVAKEFIPILELLHEGSIIIDDLEDNSDFRRGKPCLHKIYGIDVAINAGNFMYFLPLLALAKNRNRFDPATLLRAWEACIEEMTRIHLGQGCDIIWHKGLAGADRITEKEYLQMCAYKTGVLPRLAARLAVILTGGSKQLEEKLGKFGESLGILFQIRDDILNIEQSREWEKTGWKELGDDISEGKKTLLVIHTLKKAERKDRERLLEILNMHTKDQKLVKEAIGVMKKHGSIEYAREFAKNMVKRTWNEIEPMIKESKAKEKLKEFMTFAVERGV